MGLFLIRFMTVSAIDLINKIHYEYEIINQNATILRKHLIIFHKFGQRWRVQTLEKDINQIINHDNDLFALQNELNSKSKDE